MVPRSPLAEAAGVPEADKDGFFIILPNMPASAVEDLATTTACLDRLANDYPLSYDIATDTPPAHRLRTAFDDFALTI